MTIRGLYRLQSALSSIRSKQSVTLRSVGPYDTTGTGRDTEGIENLIEAGLNHPRVSFRHQVWFSGQRIILLDSDLEWCQFSTSSHQAVQNGPGHDRKRGTHQAPLHLYADSHSCGSAKLYLHPPALKTRPAVIFAARSL
jgi:hypothetical protein